MTSGPKAVLQSQYDELVLTAREREVFLSRLERDGRRGKPATKEEICLKRMRLKEFNKAVESFRKWMEKDGMQGGGRPGRFLEN